MTSSHCGHRLRTGRACQQKITGNSTRCAAGHPVVSRDETGRLFSGAYEAECDAHQGRGPRKTTSETGRYCVAL